MTVPQDKVRWRKSTFSETQGACVELHPDGLLRDSKNPDGPRLRVSMSRLLATVKTDQITR